MKSSESTTRVWSVGGDLPGTVCVEIRETEGAVAVAYGQTQHPKIREQDPVYEVR